MAFPPKKAGPPKKGKKAAAPSGGAAALRESLGQKAPMGPPPDMKKGRRPAY